MVGMNPDSGSEWETVQAGSLVIIALVIIEFGFVSVKENFFWRLEDNSFHQRYFPSSIYDKKAFYTHQSGPIRSLYLEPPGNSVFRNWNNLAQGPDSDFWNNIEVAPQPQVLNQIGMDQKIYSMQLQSVIMIIVEKWEFSFV